LLKFINFLKKFLFNFYKIKGKSLIIFLLEYIIFKNKKKNREIIINKSLKIITLFHLTLFNLLKEYFFVSIEKLIFFLN
jgi:hypothetical protein